MHPLSLSAIYDTELLTLLVLCVSCITYWFFDYLIVNLHSLDRSNAFGLFTRLYLPTSADRHKPIKKPDFFFRIELHLTSSHMNE